jgi:hypothetical protein
MVAAQTDVSHVTTVLAHVCGVHSVYGDAIPGHVLAERLASFMHLYNLYWSVRYVLLHMWTAAYSMPLADHQVDSVKKQH